MQSKRIITIVLSFILLGLFVYLLFWHAPNPTSEKRSAALKSTFENAGFTVSVQPMAADRAAPIYQPSVWESWNLDGEELLVYFDESNRADYLSARIDPSFGFCTRYGLRFVLVYAGQNEKILEVLKHLPEDTMQ